MPARMPRFVYWDSSVFLAYINGEAGRVDQIAALWEEIAEHPEDRIITSATSIVEVAFTNAERGLKALDPKVAKRIDDMWSDPTVQLVEVSDVIVRAAQNMIRDAVADGVALTPIDAIHLATALWVDRNVGRVAAFHAYDDRLRKHHTRIGISIEEPAPTTPRLPLDYGDSNASGNGETGS